MAAESGRTTASLRAQLFEKPGRFHFFQVVRMLQKLRAREPVGHDADPADEAVRFRSETSFAFPTGDVSKLVAGDEHSPDQVTVNFMGIASPGSFGSLPTPYIEEIRYQEREFKNSAMRDFFDLFNHRLVSLFYRAWERTRPEVLHDLGRKSAFESALRAVIGLEGDALRRDLPLEDAVLLARSGLLAMQPAPASAVEGLLASLLSMPVRIDQFVPAWYDIEDADKSRLGRANSTLGQDLNLGAEIRLAQPTFHVRIGPMGWSDYESLLPGTDGYRRISSIVRLAVGVALDFRVRLVLEAQDVPETRLGGDGPTPSQLGRTTWLKSEPFQEDVDDALFEPSFTREPMPRAA